MSKKICLLVDSLSSGGAEKVAANMSVSLKQKGYALFIVSMRDEIDYKYDGELFNFGLVKKSCNKLKAFLKFKQYFKNNKFDYIIDHRTRSKFIKEVLFSKFVFQNHKVIYCIHSYSLDYYFSYLNTAKLSLFPHVKKRMFVSVSNEIHDKLKQKLNVKSRTIYNYFMSKNARISSDSTLGSIDNYIIGVGRLTSIKQFDKLILSYNQSKLPEESIKLIILGDGPEKENLENTISKLKCKNHIKLLPFNKNPYRLMSSAKALVLTSKVEGFGMVLLEALSLKTPVISFNCKSGPKEIIKHGVNGLLVEDQNKKELTKALNKLLLDANYYSKIKENVQLGLEKFSEEYVIQEWINLFENQMENDFK